MIILGEVVEGRALIAPVPTDPWTEYTCFEDMIFVLRIKCTNFLSRFTRGDEGLWVIVGVFWSERCVLLLSL